MSSFEFRLLSEAEQVRLLYNEGIYLGKRKAGRKIFLLYQVEGFYIEILYRVYRRVIEQIRICETTAVLDPYLEQIDVEYLVSE